MKTPARGVLALAILLGVACERPASCVSLEERCGETAALEMYAAWRAHGDDEDWPSTLNLSACEDAHDQDDNGVCLTHGLTLAAELEDYRQYVAAAAHRDEAPAEGAPATAAEIAPAGGVAAGSRQAIPGSGFSLECPAALQFRETLGTGRSADAVYLVVYRPEGTQSHLETLSRNLAREGRDVATEAMTLPSGAPAQLTTFVTSGTSGGELHHAAVALLLGDTVFGVQVTTGDAATAASGARQVAQSIHADQ